METPSIPSIPIQQPPKTRRFSRIVIIVLLVGLIAGVSIGFAMSYSVLNGRINTLQTQLQGSAQNGTYISYPNASYYVGDNVSLSNLYQKVQPSVVVIQDLVPTYNFFGNLAGYSLQQGSGFIASVNNQLVIVTNNHVTQNAINETVTFADGNSYPAKLLGSDPLADLAVLTITPMPSDLTPLTLVSSDALQVGEPVVAVGSPYGLSGTLTTGVISSVGRTITEESSSSQSNGPTIADIIQTSTAINPGNSGGPLLNYGGDVVGITTAAVTDSQGLGFAIPSDTIMRELSTIVTSGSYNNHPSISVTGTDMNYQISQAMGTSVTYGFLVETATQNGLKGGTTQTSILGSSVTIGGDIIVAINGARITNTDALLSYLEQHTQPGQTANFTVVRNGQTQTVSVTIGKVS